MNWFNGRCLRLWVGGLNRLRPIFLSLATLLIRATKSAHFQSLILSQSSIRHVLFCLKEARLDRHHESFILIQGSTTIIFVDLDATQPLHFSFSQIIRWRKHLHICCCDKATNNAQLACCKLPYWYE